MECIRIFTEVTVRRLNFKKLLSEPPCSIRDTEAKKNYNKPSKNAVCKYYPIKITGKNGERKVFGL